MSRLSNHKTAVLAAVFAAISLGMFERVSAESPPGCTDTAISVSVTPSPGGIVHHGDQICYAVCYGATGTPNPCDVANLDSTLFLPNGVSRTITTGASISAGSFFCCPSADPRCNPLLTVADYCYVVDHADEVLSFGGCPPVKTPGVGRVVAYTEGNGESLTPAGDEVAPCATANNSIRHACCEPCTGTCTEVAKANACAFPRVFTPDKNCDEVVCTPLDCDDHILCTDDSCDPVTGDCLNTKNNALCDDGNICKNDACDPLDQAAGPDGCVHTPKPGAPCGNQTAKGECDNPDLCDEAGNCVQNAKPAGTICRPAINECDSIEYCDGTTKDCPPDVCQPAGTPCASDGDGCTEDVCDEFCACTHGDTCGTPTVTCPPDEVFECDAVDVFGDPTVVDRCNPNSQAVCTEDSTPGKLPLEETIIRTCTYTNDCGRSAMCEQRIDIVDTTAPVVTCPPDRTFECDAIGDFGEPTVEDNCDDLPDITIEVEEVIKDCTPDPVAGITPPPKLTIVRTVSATENTILVTATGEPNVGTCVQNIEIVDTNPPLLVDCPGPITICSNAGSLEFTPPTCTDTCGTCTVTCVRSDQLPLHDPVLEGPITITCIASDECVNESSCAFDVGISDSQECFEIVPTVSQWGLVVLTLLLLIGAKIHFGRRQAEWA